MMLNNASSYLYTLDNLHGKKLLNKHLFRVNNSNTRERREVSPKLTIMSLQGRSTLFIINFE